MNLFKPVLPVILFMACLLAGPFSVQAQEQGQVEVNSTDTPQEEGEESTDKDPVPHYEEGTVAGFSKLYWRLGKFDIENDEDIDNFLMINECDLYRDYFHNEFEWHDIRKAGREHIQKQKKNFPLRFTFMQPINLADYNFKKEGFNIADEYKILGVLRFEMMATDNKSKICDRDYPIPRYPKGLIVQLSRPFSLDFLPLDQEKAEKFNAEKTEDFMKLSADKQTNDILYDMRKVYLVMNVRLYSYQEDIKTKEGPWLAGFLGILEGYEIYADQARTELLYAESFRRRKRKSRFEEQMKAQYEARKARIEKERATKAAKDTGKEKE
ncbi:MAG: DUF4852 domain-containing protein [Alphaproteobacteria bacterium]